MSGDILLSSKQNFTFGLQCSQNKGIIHKSTCAPNTKTEEIKNTLVFNLLYCLLTEKLTLGINQICVHLLHYITYLEADKIGL